MQLQYANGWLGSKYGMAATWCILNKLDGLL